MKRKSHENVAYINPSVLRWALTRTDLSREQLAGKIGVSADHLTSWEDGQSRPPFDKTQKLAQALNVPFGYLFLSVPPKTEVPIPDLRTSFADAPLGANFLEVVNDALVKQDWYRDYSREIKSRKLKFVGSFGVHDDVKAVAADIRSVIGIDFAFRRSARDWGDYVSKLTHRCEDVGILVMRSGVVGNSTRRKLSSREFQGFALVDPYAPLIFVNSDDYKAAQVFTLVHELVHVWIGSSGISNTDPTPTKDSFSSIELFCNSVAVETLVPQSEFDQLWKVQEVGTLIDRLSRTFWVSTLVILRRAHELKKISTGEFISLVDAERKKYVKKASSGGDYYRNVVARMGSKFSDAVLGELREGRILYRDAARLLKLKVPTLIKFSELAK